MCEDYDCRHLFSLFIILPSMDVGFWGGEGVSVSLCGGHALGNLCTGRPGTPRAELCRLLRSLPSYDLSPIGHVDVLPRFGTLLTSWLGPAQDQTGDDRQEPSSECTGTDSRWKRCRVWRWSGNRGEPFVVGEGRAVGRLPTGMLWFAVRVDRGKSDRNERFPNHTTTTESL